MATVARVQQPEERRDVVKDEWQRWSKPVRWGRFIVHIHGVLQRDWEQIINEGEHLTDVVTRVVITGCERLLKEDLECSPWHAT